MNPYEVLKLQRGATSQQIRESYKTLVRTEHPDKGGDAESFKRIQKAYEILKDESKRSFYDATGQIPGDNASSAPQDMPFQGGVGGFPFGGMGGIPVDIHNLFGMFNNGASRTRPRTKKQGKAPPRATQIALTLKDFFYGKTIGIQLERQRFCKDCKGEGSTSMRECEDCKGSGTKTQVVQMGPFMMQNQGPCDKCNGGGKQKGDACWGCKGSGMIKEEKKLETRIEPGMAPGETIVFAGESSDTHEYTLAGDVLIELQEAEEDNVWERKGDDLCIAVEISWSESIVGCSVRIEGHPGFSEACVFPIPPCSRNGDVVVVKGYGMPKKGSSVRGNALLTVQVKEATSSEKVASISNRKQLTEMFQVVDRESFSTDHVVGL
jgi:molecular chaperone DnaJ